MKWVDMKGVGHPILLFSGETARIGCVIEQHTDKIVNREMHKVPILIYLNNLQGFSLSGRRRHKLSDGRGRDIDEDYAFWVCTSDSLSSSQIEGDWNLVLFTYFSRPVFFDT